jgi:hypothetical protein
MFAPNNPPDYNVDDYLAVDSTEMVYIELIGAAANTAYTYNVPAGKKLIILGLYGEVYGSGAQPVGYLSIGNFVLLEANSATQVGIHATCRRFPFNAMDKGTHANANTKPRLRYMGGNFSDAGTPAAPGLLGGTSPVPGIKIDSQYIFCLKAGTAIVLQTATSLFASCEASFIGYLIDE